MDIFSTNRSLSFCGGGKVSRPFSRRLISRPISSRFFWSVSDDTAGDIVEPFSTYIQIPTHSLKRPVQWEQSVSMIQMIDIEMVLCWDGDVQRSVRCPMYLCWPFPHGSAHLQSSWHQDTAPGTHQRGNGAVSASDQLIWCHAADWKKDCFITGTLKGQSIKRYFMSAWVVSSAGLKKSRRRF